MPLRWWLWFVLEHEIHHKAQLALYLREMGKVPPFFALPLPDLVRTFRSVSSWAGYERAAGTQRTRSRGGARRPATTPPPDRCRAQRAHRREMCVISLRLTPPLSVLSAKSSPR